MKALISFAAVLAISMSLHNPAMAQDVGTIRIGQADNGALDLVQLIAYKEAEKRGVKIIVSPMKSDDVTFQAVLSGQLDMGVGDAYAPIKNLKAPVRNIFQARKLAYIPVVDKTVYPTWASLNGQTFAVHSRGSGTETMAKIMEQANGIKFGNVMYLPGSATRFAAMERGQIKATYLDLVTSKMLVQKDPARFAILPSGDQSASDSSIYASQAFLKEHAEAVQILLEELLKAARETKKNAAWPAEQRTALNLLPDLSEKQIANITPYFQDAEAADIIPVDGGGRASAQADLQFQAAAGVFDKAAMPDVGDYWEFAPLDAALKALQ